MLIQGQFLKVWPVENESILGASEMPQTRLHSERLACPTQSTAPVKMRRKPPNVSRR
jgi:hypothetical protein